MSVQFQFQTYSDSRSEGNSQNISTWFSGCIRTRNKNRLLGLLQSGRNPNKIFSDFDVSLPLANDEEKMVKISPYLTNGKLPSTTILHEAIIYNDEDVINILLNFGSRINDFCGADHNGLSCLMLAVVLGHNNLLDLLVKRGCNYCMFNGEQRTALDLAIMTNNTSAVTFFAPFKRFFYFQNPRRSKLTVCEYLTMYADHENSSSVIEQMLAIGYDLGEMPGESVLLCIFKNFNLVNSSAINVIRSIAEHHRVNTGIDLLREPLGKNGRTILHVMSQKGHGKAVEVLLEVGADVNEGDNDGDSPLHLVLREPVNAKNIEVIRILLEAGADLFKRNEKKLSPLDAALEFSQIHSVIAKLVSSQAQVISWGDKIHELLSDATAKLNPKVLQFLRSRKVTFQAMNSKNQSPLHVLLETYGSTAYQDDLLQCVNVLLENESILDVVDTTGMNPAMTALSKNAAPSIIIRLISGPICTQHINPRGQDILSMIISGYKGKEDGKLSLVQFAVKKGALVNNPSRFGCKSLIAACEEAGLSSQGIPKFLLSKGFKPLREDIDCISTWSLSLLELSLEHCNSTTICTQFPNILITSLKTFIPRISNPKSPGVTSLLSITRKLVHDFHVDVNYHEREKHVLHLLIQFQVTHKYDVLPLVREILNGPDIDLNVGFDCVTGNPLSHALKVGEFTIADLLIKSMSDFSKIDIQTVALKYGFSGIVTTLIRKGVHFDHKFFERAFGQQDMEIIKEMTWLKDHVNNGTVRRSEPDSSKISATKRVKKEHK